MDIVTPLDEGYKGMSEQVKMEQRESVTKP
jgi:hypothetical protein